MNFFLVGLLLIPALLLSTQWCLATGLTTEDEIGVNLSGQFNLRPSLAVNLTHHDNINLTAENERSDFISSLSPSCSLEHPLLARGLATLGYTGNYAYYSRNEPENWQTNQFSFKANYEKHSGIIAELSNDYIESEDPFGADNEYGEGEQKKRWTNSLRGKIGFDFSNKLKIFGSFYRSKQDYDDDLRDWSQDYKNEEYGLSVQLRLMPKTWFFTRYYTGETDYFTSSPPGYIGNPVNDSNDADYSWDRINAGFITDPTSKIRGELNFGYRWETYKNKLDSFGNVYNDKNTWIARTNIAYLFSPKTKLSFLLSRAIFGSGSASNTSYESLTLGVTVNHRFRKKLILNTSINSQFNDYNTTTFGTKRDDDELDFKLGLTYEVNRWFTLSTKYTFTDKDSNYSQFSYTSNQVTFSLTGEI